jgi:glycosyltransferase involved in cell wall biosynthesis
MKILYDQQIFSFQNYGGISRYFYELISRVGRTENEVLIDGKFSNNIYLPKLKGGVGDFFPKFNLPYKNVLSFYANVFLDSYHLKGADFDILHATYFHPYFLNYLKGKPYVITVYDMAHELFSKDVRGFVKKTMEYKRRAVLKANRIIAISENTKKDLMKLYDIPKEKIEVIYLGNPLENVKPSKLEVLPERYLLFVGNRQGYKNFKFFLESVSSILRKDRSLFLVCAGGGPFLTSEKIFISRLGIERQVVQIGFKDDSELAYIYKKALVYVLPSLYEGFGLTVLEAFSMSCPVVASNTSSIPEVCGKAVMYVNPKNHKSIKNTVEKVIEDDKLRNDLSKLGLEQVEKFSWNKTVKETLNVYKNVLKL